MESVISNDADKKKLEKTNKEISSLEGKQKKLTDMFLEDSITKEAYDEKYIEITKRIQKLIDEKGILAENVKEQKHIGKRMTGLRKALQTENALDEFDRIVFESIVEKVIVGEVDGEGNVDPFKLTFVFAGNGEQSLHNVKERYKNLVKEYSYDERSVATK